jgi:hypothetical protein
MRKTCDSSNTAAIVSLSSRALARSWPNGFSQPRRDGAELGRRYGEVEEAVSPRPALLVELVEVLGELLVGGRVLEGARHVGDAALEVAPHGVVDGLPPRELGDAALHLAPEVLVRLLAPRHAHHGEAARQRAADRQVVEPRHQLALREVAGRAEDDDGARFAGAIVGEASPQGVGRSVHGGGPFLGAFRLRPS